MRAANAERILAAWSFFLSPFEERILPFDKSAAEVYGDIRATLERKGTMIGDRDCMIAAIALCHGLTVVTANVDEFQRVPGLSLEDWCVR